MEKLEQYLKIDEKEKSSQNKKFDDEKNSMV